MVTNIIQRCGYLLLACSSLCCGAEDISPEAAAKFYERAEWKAEDYFDDPLVLELCSAIEANDLEVMRRLIEEGVDVNAKGKGNVTPLLWAYPANQLDRFKLLLEHGADPNVQLTENMPKVKGFFSKHHLVIKGDSVTWMAMQTRFDSYLELVIEHGADVNQIHPRWKNTLLDSAVGWNKFEAVKLLVKNGANLDWKTPEGSTIVMGPIQNGKYEMTLLLLELGADYSIYTPESNFRLIHFVAREERTRDFVRKKDWRKSNDFRRSNPWVEGDEERHQKVVDWLEARGEDYKKAQAEERLWWEWLQKDEYEEKMRKAYYDRIQREAYERIRREKSKVETSDKQHLEQIDSSLDNASDSDNESLRDAMEKQGERSS